MPCEAGDRDGDAGCRQRENLLKSAKLPKNTAPDSDPAAGMDRAVVKDEEWAWAVVWAAAWAPVWGKTQSTPRTNESST